MKVYDKFDSEVTERLMAGQVGVIPTDTIYGLVAPLNNKQSVERIYEVKHRPEHKRVGTTLIASPEQISKLIDKESLRHASLHWPGVSIELAVGDELWYAHRGNGTLAFRIPSNKALIELLLKTGPLATTSANFASEPPVSTVNEAVEKFGDTVDFYVDGGDRHNARPSRIVKINPNGNVEIIRE